MQNKLLFLPLIIILAICLLLFVGLQQDPKKIASALIDKPVPEFQLANLLQPDQALNNTDLPKQPFLLNVWGSWCGYCHQEHPFLMQLAAQGIPIVGIDYRDNPQAGREMLQQKGNPFILTLNDSQGKFALSLGVDGAPETFLVDGNGIIRYRHSGALDQKQWFQFFIPEMNKLNTK